VKHEAVGDKNEALEMLEQSLIEEATRREDDSLAEWNAVMSRKLEEHDGKASAEAVDRDATHLVRTALNPTP